MSNDAWALSIVIPALNEEEAIGGTASRCLAAIPEIQEQTPVAEVEVIVVSDGSTDRTAEIARGIAGVRVIEFPVNQGYGAAIQEGFRQAKGTLVGFLDADGTCDPRHFVPLCNAATRDGADIALGSRLGPDSKMPAIRRIGNRIYAFLLGLLCGRWVTDTSSGMRVLRRSALPELAPLPTGLHFTPAMSARAMMNGLKVVEIPMAYSERIGRSKLSVLADGVRFLRAIIEGVLCYRPERIFLMGFVACFAIGAAWAAYPTEFYWKNASIEEWMIYRFLVCFLLGSAGFSLLCAAAIANRMNLLHRSERAERFFWASIATNLFEGLTLKVFVSLAVLASLLLLLPGIVEYVSTSHITPTRLHWSRTVVGVFGLMLAFQATVTGILLQVIEIWEKAKRLNGSR